MMITSTSATTYQMVPCDDCGALTLCDILICETDPRRYGYCECGGMAIERAPLWGTVSTTISVRVAR